MNTKSVSSVLPILLPYAFGYFLSYFLRNVNAVIAPDLANEIGLSAADLGLLTSAYLIGFAMAQLPLGAALDKWGARRVESALLVIAALGCLGFAMGQTLMQLALARGLIGIGVSACLMAAFKAFSQSFSPLRQASLNSSIMVAGGLGGLNGQRADGLDFACGWVARDFSLFGRPGADRRIYLAQGTREFSACGARTFSRVD